MSEATGYIRRGKIVVIRLQIKIRVNRSENLAHNLINSGRPHEQR